MADRNSIRLPHRYKQERHFYTKLVHKITHLQSKRHIWKISNINWFEVYLLIELLPFNFFFYLPAKLREMEGNARRMSLEFETT